MAALPWCYSARLLNVLFTFNLRPVTTGEVDYGFDLQFTEKWRIMNFVSRTGQFWGLFRKAHIEGTIHNSN